MPRNDPLTTKADLLYRCAGVTGFGWTVLILGYLAMLIGFGPAHLAEPGFLLRLAIVLFVLTFGLDALKGRV